MMMKFDKDGDVVVCGVCCTAYMTDILDEIAEQSPSTDPQDICPVCNAFGPFQATPDGQLMGENLT
ncbi:unnamed protein product [marine sediment metagenome]|uniref:Uncharacterized protein n=1 Tax=marine sediment metagenome TaxID=412755 RepID=X0W5U5_9ZZZZ